MGTGHYSSKTYQAVTNSRNYQSKSADQIFSDSLKLTMNPANLKNGIRECRDSLDHPVSIPIMVFVDVTGSMGRIPYNLIQNNFPKMMNTLVSHGVEDAQICFGAIGDHITDSVPLQIGQFEQETTKLIDDLSNIYIEGGGGGQCMESYPLAWYLAGYHTSTDAYEKRGAKGYLFTIGDESFHSQYSSDFIKRMMGTAESLGDFTAEQLYEKASEKYHVFHVHVEDGSYDTNYIKNEWIQLLNENFLVLRDSNSIAELIGTTVSVINGANMNSVLNTLSDHAAKDISNTLAKIQSFLPDKNDEGSSIITL